jgi:hypothetical protein
MPAKNPDFQEKYASLIEQAGATEEWLDSFSEAIQITPERVWAMPLSRLNRLNLRRAGGGQTPPRPVFPARRPSCRCPCTRP